MKRPVLICVGIFALGVAVGGLVGGLVGGSLWTAPPAEAAEAPGVPDSTAAAILDALARIERRLDALEVEPPPAQAAAPVIQRVDALPESVDLSSVLRAIAELRAALDPHLVDDRTLAGGGLVALKAKHPEAKWPQLRELIHAWNLDEETTRGDVLLLGYREIIERYGSPTTTWGGENGINWLYYDALDPVTGETSTEIWIHFADGLVTDMGIKQP